MNPVTNIPLIVVGYRNPKDLTDCFQALRRMVAEPKFDVYVCENGGAAAFDLLVPALCGVDGPCDLEADMQATPEETPHFVRIRRLRLLGREARVFVAEAKENFGYAGAINAWLRILMAFPAWPGAWILNPDTQPDDRALAELVAWSALRCKGMVGSRIVSSARPELIHTRGLRWRPLRASTEGIDYHTSAAIEPDPDKLEARMDAPSGASFYVTRPCLEHIGLMDERYFLYFEDLDWGYRAKTYCGVGYAYNSIVPHRGGTTIGTAGQRSARSALSVYLEFRNRIHFVRAHHRAWLPWTLFVLLIRPFEYVVVGSFSKSLAAFHGIFAGLAGKTGRPDSVINSHRR
jgi:GT2 family glycosyltransferase